jgi:hypothetical protein
MLAVATVYLSRGSGGGSGLVSGFGSGFVSGFERLSFAGFAPSFVSPVDGNSCGENRAALPNQATVPAPAK